MDLFEHLQRYPESPGYQRTDTSKAEAEAIAPHANGLQDRVLAAIRTARGTGLTMEECAAAVGEGRHSVQPRTSELRLKNLIRDSGQRRKLASGRNGIVWVAA